MEEVELARVELEQKERAQNLILDDIRKLSLCSDSSADQSPEKDIDLWMISGGRSILVSVELLNECYVVTLCSSW